MIKRKTIGKTQIVLGGVLFLVTIIASFFIIKEVYIGALVTGISGVTETWGEVSQEINATSIGIIGLVVSNVVLQGQIIKTTMYLFGICSLILVVLSIVLILQGLANISQK